MDGRTTNKTGRSWLSKELPSRPGLDPTKAVGIACACYITVFVLLVQAHGPAIQLRPLRPAQAVPLACATVAIVASLLLSWRMPCLLSWAFMGMVASGFLEVSNFTLAQSSQVSLGVFGLGLPFLVLLEVILTMEGATARARVVFRPRPLVKALLLVTIVMLSLMAAFSYVPGLQQYSASPEAATFQTAMIAGISTMALASILLRRPRGLMGGS